jgi:hypothetical protein
MKLAAVAKIRWMTPWQVIEEALGRRKPPRKAQWLAEQLDVSAQVLANWKARGVPPSRYRALADVLGLTVDQIEGVAPLPWESESGWPFPDIDQARYLRLTEMQKGEIQRKVRELISEFEVGRTGKSSGPASNGTHRKAA